MESDVDDGGYSDDLPGCGGSKSPTLKQTLTAIVAPVDKKLGDLVGVNQKQLSVQQDIAAKQGELVSLQQESNAIQSELRTIAQQQLAIQSQQLVVMQQQLVVQQQQLLVQRQQLLTQRQQLLANQVAATQLSIQTQLQLQDRMHRDAQRALKESAYSLKNTIEVVCRDSRTLMQCAGLFALLTQAQYAGLIPNRLDEIKDKEYAREAILTARRAYTAAISALSPEERSDYEFLLQYAGARRYLWAEADHASKRASDVEASGHAAFERLQWLIAHEPSALLAATKEAELEDKRQSISSRLGWFGGGVGLLSLTGLAFEPLITVGGGVVFVVSAAVGLVIRKVPQTARAAHAAIEYEIASLRALLPGIDTSLSSEQQYRANAIANRDQLEAKIRGFVSRYKELEQWF